MTETHGGATKSESRILCEGYHDRAFWKGWLTHIGFQDLGSSKDKVHDPWGKPVVGGQFGFRSPAGHFLRIVPCGGKERILDSMKAALTLINTQTMKNLVINWDADTPDEQGGDEAKFRQSIGTAIETIGESETLQDSADWLFRNGGHETRVSLVVWKTNDEPSKSLPKKQTLERLVSAAICAAYPERGDEVTAWLESRTSPPGPSPKEHSWSHMAGWYAELGGEAFLSEIWRDESIRAALKKRLTENGSWTVAEELLGT